MPAAVQPAGGLFAGSDQSRGAVPTALVSADHHIPNAIHSGVQEALRARYAIMESWGRMIAGLLVLVPSRSTDFTVSNVAVTIPHPDGGLLPFILAQ